MSQSSNLENSASTTPWDANAQEIGAVDHQRTHSLLHHFNNSQFLNPSKNKIELSSIRVVNNYFNSFFAGRILSSSVTGSR
jgi:hypothetical protein